MRIPIVLIALGLAACQTGNGSGYTDDPHEGYVDPGPSQIANALVRLAGEATDADGQPVALRVDGIWADDGLWYVLRDGDAWTAIAEIEFGRSGYPMSLYRMPAGARQLDADGFSEVSPDALERAEGCTVLFQRTGPGDYLGRTQGPTCASSREGTATETLELTIGDSLIWSRRGFDTNGAQLWGPPPTPESDL